MKLKISISIALIICLLNLAESKPGASNCSRDCLSTGEIANRPLTTAYYWCNRNGRNAAPFTGALSCSERNENNCQSDYFCTLVEVVGGSKKCKGFCGACCHSNSADRETACTNDDADPRCSHMRSAAAPGKKKLKLK